MSIRRRIATVYSDFISDIDRLSRLDNLNQMRFRAGPGRPSASLMSKGQMILITEGLFAKAVSRYEAFLEETFILYCCGKLTRRGRTVSSYLTPRDRAHGREIIKGSQRYLEWNSPDKIIKRSETFLIDGGPIKFAMTTKQSKLINIKRVRNAIAHQSMEAEKEFEKVVSSELTVAPIRIPRPGEFLLTTDPRNPNEYFLQGYLGILKEVADIATA